MYSELSKNFSVVKDKTAHEVCEFIGGKVKINDFTNCCAVRLSYAFNKSGLKIPYIQNETVSGEQKPNESKEWYIFRVRVFKKYLDEKYTKITTNKKSLDEFKGKTGIIVFDVNWSDATGHVDLFDGNKVEGHDYTADSNSISLYLIN